MYKSSWIHISIDLLRAWQGLAVTLLQSGDKAWGCFLFSPIRLQHSPNIFLHNPCSSHWGQI